MSHQNYGESDYWESRNWMLTLTGLKSTKVQIEFERLILTVRVNGECGDYLQINSLNKICTPPAGKITVDLPSATSKSVSFNLITTESYNVDGFWLQYKGMLKF